jgi:ATP-dependent Lhr-like helicase
VQRWVYRRGWRTLHEIQELAVEPILNGDDCIVAAPTAGGKTEAAFLPVCSAIASAPTPSVQALYISPLKALINDQYRRMEELAEDLGLPVFPWHGDVAGSQKQRFLAKPGGILMITPESLESLFVNRGTRMKGLFSGLSYVLVDELHAFIGMERGKQLQCLMHRLELVIRRRVSRIGLSATLGDMGLAAEFLRPGGDREAVRLIVSTSAVSDIVAQLRGYRVSEPEGQPPAALTSRPGQACSSQGGSLAPVVEHLFEVLRGTHNLVFANSRSRVEAYADALRHLSDATRVPNEFVPHHGSLSKGIREDAEVRLQDTSRPCTAVCTSTLELGIDVGDIECVAQIGPPPSVAAVRQRLGRSGRRGGRPAQLRMYVQEPEITPETHPQDMIRAQLVQSVAMLRLLGRGWCELPRPNQLHLSTLVQQVLSMIAQFGGVRAGDAYGALCRSGPFAAVSPTIFADLLRCLGEKDMITQSVDEALLLGSAGERIVNHYSFYSAFLTPEEFRIECKGVMLGSLPVDTCLEPGGYLIFAGRRWVVDEVDDKHKVVYVQPAEGGVIPHFGGTGGVVADQVREEMRLVYEVEHEYPYLDEGARDLLDEGRREYREIGLAGRGVLPWGASVLLFPWVGDRALNTLTMLLAGRSLCACRAGVGIEVQRCNVAKAARHLHALAEAGLQDPLEVARRVKNKRTEKYHWCLSDELLTADYASSSVDAAGAARAVENLMASL